MAVPPFGLGSTCPCHNSHPEMPVSNIALMASSSGRSLKLLVCAPSCTPATLEFDAPKVIETGIDAAAILPNSRLEYMVVIMEHAARRHNREPDLDNGI